MKVQSTFYPDLISKTVDILLITSFITNEWPIYWYLMHLGCWFARKNVANYALLGCKTFSLEIWLWKILDKYHVWSQNHLKSTRNYYWDQMESISSSWLDWLGHKAVTRWGKLFFFKVVSIYGHFGGLMLVRLVCCTFLSTSKWAISCWMYIYRQQLSFSKSG